MIAFQLFILCLSCYLFKDACGQADFVGPEEMGQIDESDLTEASGLAASRIYPNLLYAHNDAGGSARIFAIDALSGEVVAEYDIDGAGFCDWEDIAVGTFNGLSAIYIGDIGGNSNDGDCNKIYVVYEPDVVEDGNAIELETVAVALYDWNEDNCETLMVDPAGTVYLITKVEDGETAKLYYLPNNAFDEGVGRVDALGGTFIGIVDEDDTAPVAGDISPDGTEVLIKFKEEVYYWAWDSDSETLAEVMARAPEQVMAYVEEEDGEAIAWSREGDAFYVLSEGANQPLYRYAKV